MNNIKNFLLRYAKNKSLIDVNSGEDGTEKLSKDVQAIQQRIHNVNLNHQSLLSKLPTSIKIKATKEERALKNYLKTVEEWEKNSHFFASRCMRSEQ